MKNTGLRPYLYEQLFFQAVEHAKQVTGRPVTVSQARRLRADVAAALGAEFDSADIKISTLLNAIEDTMQAGVVGWEPLYTQRTATDPMYLQVSYGFMDMAGLDHVDTDKNTVAAKPGPLGRRLPISPYDPRFATRATVKRAGSTQLLIPDDMIEELANGEVDRIPAIRDGALKLYLGEESNGKLIEAGSAYTLDDMSGLSELMGYMSESEYNEVRQWVIAGARNRVGIVEPEHFMSAKALSRSVAILDELREQGTEYTVSCDRKQGQIRAQISGTSISIRLTDTAANERFVGHRIYDGGVMTYLSTNYHPRGSKQVAEYDPTPEDCVALLRFVQGKSVQRRDVDLPVGVFNTHDERRWSKDTRRFEPTPVNDAYYSNKTRAVVLADLPGIDPREGAKIVIRQDAKKRSETSRYFSNAEQGMEFLDESITSARDVLQTSVNVEELIAQAREHGEDYRAGEYVPEFSGDPSIASIQRTYWDVLTGGQRELLKPGVSESEYYDKIGVIGAMPLDDEVLEAEHAALMSELRYAGAPEDMVRDHSVDLLDAMIGTGPNRFDPVTVSQYMYSEHGVWRNNDDIIAALRVTGIDPDQLIGSGFYNNIVKDRLISFDETTAQPLADVSDPFLARINDVVTRSVEANACLLNEAEIDGNGIIRYRASRISSALSNEDVEEYPDVEGYLGQVFVPGRYGELVTKFAGGDNYLFVPGYEASIVAQHPGETLSVEERTRLRGYEQLMVEQIQYRIASDLLTTRDLVGETTGLNGVYRRLYDVRHEVDFIELSRQEGLSDEWREAILTTEGRRVRYSNEIKSGSTINAAYQAESGRSQHDPSNDNYSDAWTLTGGRNMAIMTAEGDGYFDPIMTSSSTNQGITRYLVESAQVNPDGTIVRGDLDDRAPLMKHPDTRFMNYNPFDRQQMTASNLMQAAAVTEPVGTALMTFGGWTADDPLVISKRFAERYQIRGADSAMRTLVIGDKLSDLNGNKGVISLIVDPEMSDEEALAQGLTAPVALFRDNPGLDVVMSPFSAVSRFNGGSARELMDGEPAALRLTDGTEVEAAIGQMRFVVTHMAVDSKTRIYDDDDLAQGRGRKASGQLAWALGSQGCEDVLAECYGTNSTAVSNLREMLITMGLDMEVDGTLREGWAEQGEGDGRRLFKLPELKSNSRGGLDAVTMKREFGELIGTRGGDLELPFPLHFATGQQIPQVGENRWAMPVMSSHLRSGQDLGDGTSTSHDYTNHYLTVYDAAIRYLDASFQLRDHASGERVLDEVALERNRDLVAKAADKAQMAFDAISDDLKRRRFSGKHNVFRDQIMANRMPRSATAVWTSDPRLDIDQISMGPAMAEAINVSADEHVLVWRDPMLRDAGVRYMRVRIDERLTGVAIHPAMDKSFDGDFDGDSVAVVNLTTKAARREAMSKLSVGANLLDLGVKLEDGTYPLMMQDSLDTKVSQHQYPALSETFEALRMRANDLYVDVQDGALDDSEIREAQRGLVSDLSDYYWEALAIQYGGAVVRLGDTKSHLEGLMHDCVETGAKGSASKIRDYARYLGADPDTYEDLGVTQHTRADDEAVEYATAVKSHGTGVAGTFSQRGVKALRNTALKDVLELTYPVTQSILQSKHDPEDARHKYAMLMGPARDLWRGRQLVEVRDSNGTRSWQAARDEDGNVLQADAEAWQAQFLAVYTAKDGLNVAINPDCVRAVAQALTGPNGKIVDMETEPVGLNATSSPMDRLAYGGTFETLMEAAARRENLFDGAQNSHFAPYVVRQNIAELAGYDQRLEAGPAEGEEFVADPELTLIAKRDTLATGKARGQAARSPMARTVKVRPVLVSAGIEDVAYSDDEDLQL